MWSKNDKTRHSNELELLAALFMLKSLGRDITESHVLIKIDNTTAFNYINHMGSRKEPCSSIARQIWEWCLTKNIWLTASHIPGAKNVEADAQRQGVL